jgi:hypothetical protein
MFFCLQNEEKMGFHGMADGFRGIKWCGEMGLFLSLGRTKTRSIFPYAFTVS